MGWISPNELHEAAKRQYLEGRDPQTPEEWNLCVNFWAYNIDPELSIQATLLMARLMECPLRDDVVRDIAEFQVARFQGAKRKVT